MYICNKERRKDKINSKIDIIPRFARVLKLYDYNEIILIKVLFIYIDNIGINLESSDPFV